MKKNKMDMWNLFTKSFTVFDSKGILIILLIRFVVGTIFDLNFNFNSGNKIISSSLFIEFVCDYIFTVIVLLMIDHQKTNILNLISIKRSLFNSFLLSLGWLIICTMLFISLVNVENALVLGLLLILMIIISIVSIDVGFAITYILLDNVSIKEAIKLSISIISGYRLKLMLTMFIFSIFLSSISILLDTIDIDTHPKKILNYGYIKDILDLFLRIYYISFFYHFWANRNNRFAPLDIYKNSTFWSN
jgi:hypothetical protein